MTKELIILKMGGAAITDKNQEFTAKPKIISSVLKELQDIEAPLILIHGAGSFAHTLAKKYMVANGFHPAIDHEAQLLGISKIRNSMQRLHQMILDEAEQLEMRTFSLPISSTLVSKGQENIEASFFLPFQKAIDLGFIPVSYGDMSFDTTDAGFLVISGDRIIQLLAEYFEDYTIRVIFGSDVDGLYSKDPKYEDAELIEEIRYDEIDQWISVAGQSAGVDVTGGMTGKLQQMRKISQYVDRIDLLNLTVPRRLTKLLNGETTIGTKFCK